MDSKLRQVFFQQTTLQNQALEQISPGETVIVIITDAEMESHVISRALNKDLDEKTFSVTGVHGENMPLSGQTKVKVTREK